MSELRDFLISHIEISEQTGCWNWIGAIRPDGYGSMRIPHTRPTVLAHRICYQEFIGEIPTELELDHLYRNRRCINPDHLETVTHAQNLFRIRGTDTQCKNGHLRSIENTILSTFKGKTTSKCRICDRERSLSRYHQQVKEKSV